MITRYSFIKAPFLLHLFVVAMCSVNTSNAVSLDWQADIDALQRELEARHINLYHSISKKDLTRQLFQVKKELPNLSQTELMVRLMGITKQIGDGHTQFNYWGSKFHRYPLRVRQVGDQLRLFEIPVAHQHLLGMRLHSVNDTSSSQLMRSLKTVLQGVENSLSEQHRLAETLNVVEVLEGLHITKPGLQATFTFMDEKGGLHSITLNVRNSAPLASLPQSMPTGFAKHKLSDEYLDVLVNSSLQTLYLDFKKYPSFPTMESFVKKLQSLIKDKAIKRCIIDFRHNGGGDFFVGLTLAWGLVTIDSLDWQKGIYVLIGRQTFSASMSNAVQYRQILNATLVGEPTGSNPVGYQDADTFELPHSRWKVMYSKRLYRFQDYATQGVLPDINLPEDWSSLVQGKDNQLEWILNKIRNQ